MSAPGDAPVVREFGSWTALAFVVGTVVGTGIYLKPSQVARMAPEPWQNLLLWLTGGLFALCGAIAYARLATIWPASGGAYVYLRHCYGGWVSSLLLAADVLLARPAAVGALATGIGLIWGLGPGQTVLAATGTLLCLTLAQLIGRRVTGVVQVLLTALQMLPLLLIAGAGVGLPSLAHSAPVAADGPLWASGFLAVLWAYDGWYNITILGGEVTRPERNLRRSLIGGVALVTLLYVGLNALLLAKIPRETVLAQGVPFLALLEGWGAQSLATTIKWGLSLALLATLNGTLACGPRMLSAGSLGGLLSSSLGRDQSGRQATGLFSMWCLGLLLLFAGLPSQFALFDRLSEYTAVVVAGLSGLTVSCIFRLPQFGHTADGWTRLAAGVFLIIDLVLVVFLGWERPALALGGAGSVLALGSLLWFLRSSRTAQTD